MAAHRGTLPSATPPVVTPCTTLHSWPGSWLPSPAPASLTTQGAAAECPAPWQCGDMPGWSSRVRGCRVPNCRGAAKQWSPLASSSPHTAAASVDTIRGRRVSGGRVHPRVGGSGDLQHVPAQAPAAAAGGAAGGGGGAVLLPAVSLSTGPGCSAPRLLRRWNDNNLTIT